MDRYIVSIDQSTQGTKALLFDKTGSLIRRTDLPHRQIVEGDGWVSHDGEEIYRNMIQAIRELVEGSGIDKSAVAGIGISNQRETSIIWDRTTGKPLAHAVVWQCARAAAVCERESIRTHGDEIFQRTGLKLSPYFPAAKFTWLLEHVEGAMKKATAHTLCMGTMDSYLVYQMTHGKSYLTDYSNASRTQLFNIFAQRWDQEICGWFGIDMENLPQVVDSNSCFGYTDCEGFFDTPIPIHAVLGDSHAALFGQDCRSKGLAKATYGTGSSIMMNIGGYPILSRQGLVTSLAWGINGKVEYVLEGNLNYTGAVVTWLKDDLHLISNPAESGELAETAEKNDQLYLVPAFTGLGAPYWDSQARAAIIGMDRTTGRAELVRAAVECIAYQIADVVFAMEEDAGFKIGCLRTDGGPTRNKYLMRFQSDILQADVSVPDAEELSGIGAAYLAGLTLDVWGEDVFTRTGRNIYAPSLALEQQKEKYMGWRNAVKSVLQAAQPKSL